MQYSGFKVNDKDISDIIQDSSNRLLGTSYEYLKTNFRGFRVGGTTIKFSDYNELYHPFKYDTKINNYFINSNNETNKGDSASGFSPIFIERFKYSPSTNETVTFAYQSDSDDPTGRENIQMGKLYIYRGNNINDTVIPIQYNVPTTFILAVVGAGGGGCSGGGIWKQRSAYGGGCAPLFVFNVELPYGKSSSPVVFMKLNLGKGGSGGSNWKSGSKGSQSEVYFYKNGVKTLIASIPGGEGGQLKDSTTMFESLVKNENASYTTASYYENINKIPFGEVKKGRIAINKAVSSLKPYYWVIPSGKRPDPNEYYVYLDETPYFVGSYVRLGYNPTCWQSNLQDSRIANTPVTSGHYYNIKPLNYIATSNNWVNGFGQVRMNITTGVPSMLGVGGMYAQQGKNGGNGTFGSGGGPGGIASDIFDGGKGSGGSGGNAGFALYW